MQVQSATLSYLSVATRSQPWIEFSRSRDLAAGCSRLSREGPEGHACSWACGLASQLIYLHPPALAADRDATTSCCSLAHHTHLSVITNGSMISAMICFQFPRLYSALLCFGAFISGMMGRSYSLIGGILLWPCFISVLHSYFSSWIVCVDVSDIQSINAERVSIEKCYVYHNLMIHSLSKDKAPVDLL